MTDEESPYCESCGSGFWYRRALELQGRLESERKANAELKEKVAKLEARKCSHGPYEFYGTTDCKNTDPEGRGCSGRVTLYTLNDGLCVGC